MDKYELNSYVENGNNGILGAKMMEAFLDAYTHNAKLDQRHSPLLAESLNGLPPTRELFILATTPLGSSQFLYRTDNWLVYEDGLVIQCAGADILRDEAFAYAEALASARVNVEIHCHAGLPHCFPVMLTSISETNKFYSKYSRFLEKYAGPSDGKS